MNIFKMIRKDQKGFTLVELLVVVVILGILATLAVQSIGNKADEARVSKAMGDIRTLSSAVELYRIDNGNYPTQLADLVTSPAGLTTWDGPYIKAVNNDPWDHAYDYTNTTGVIYSWGPDGDDDNGSDAGDDEDDISL